MSPLAREALFLMGAIVFSVTAIAFTLWVTLAMPCSSFPGFMAPPSRCVVLKP